MKIVHLCIACFYPDGYSYQENMLPKYHKILGHEVEVIASLETFNKEGKKDYLPKGSVYYNEYDIKVTRLDYFKDNKIFKKIKKYIGLYEAIQKAKPDIIFVHGCQSVDMKVVVKYLKNYRNVKVFVDNHADFSNSATTWLSKNIVHRILWRYYAKLLEPFTTKFYGVLPARVDFIIDMYGIDSNKVELLVMGSDDEHIDAANEKVIKANIRKKFNIKEDDFLIVTGGKIDSYKKQTLLLMEAVKKINNPSVKLLVFGSVTEELKDEVDRLDDKNLVKYIGWVDSQDTYKYFRAADLVVFPGRHSVLWEQVAGIGVPMVIKYWDGTNHIDIGGNCKFLYKDSVTEIYEVIKEIVENEEYYNQLLEKAMNEGREKFSYKKIAERSIRG